MAYQSFRTMVPLWVGDMLTLIACSMTAWALTRLTFPDRLFASAPSQMGTLLAISLVVFPLHGLYPGSGLNPIYELRQLVVGTSVTFVMLLMGNLAFGELFLPEAFFIGVGFCIAVTAMPISRIFVRRFLSHRDWWGQRVLIVGAHSRAQQVLNWVERHPGFGYRVVGMVDDHSTHWEDGSEISATKYLGAPRDLRSLAEKKRAATAIVPVGHGQSGDMARLVDRVALAVPNLVILPELHGMPSLWNRTYECADQTAIHVQERLLMPGPRMAKRVIDILMASLAGLLALPLIIGVAVAVKMMTRGPVFFSQERVGLHGKKFRVWKFRTMIPDADRKLAECLARDPELRAEWEENSKLQKDPRIVPGIGHFLRATSLDELPQIWNVLRGDMSLVGPRPIEAETVPKYHDRYRYYLRVLPGMTGLWQISGRNSTTFDERVSLDSYYVRNWSPWFDLYIILRTFKTVLYREGV
ncbi:MAG: undecaprenyl-phosphate galactose phosphotransferase WbaP [Planctomycetales bacterium]|nr:undecaprenyl-phosphate galactose phosphotransferase WbaP [Planctomycetales bacterium]